MLYITVEDVLNKLGGVDTSKISDLEDRIQSVYIPSAQAQVISSLGYNPVEQTQTRFYDGNGRQYLPLMSTPVQSISSCIIYTIPYTSIWVQFRNIAKKNVVDCYGNIITTSTAPGISTDLVLDCVQGIIEIPETTDQVLSEFMPQFPCFLKGLSNIEVTFTSGYSVLTLPQQIKDATSYFAAIFVLSALGDKSSKGITSISIGQMSRSFGDRVFRGRINECNTLCEVLLEPFRNILGIQ